MAHAIWSGSINFGLVAIPVKLFTAVRESADIRFHFLHDADYGRIKNERVCSEDNKPVPWEHIVRGYEYEKGQYVVITDEDLEKANVEATQSVDIVEFVELSEIDPMLFDKPYYLEPQKNGRHAYALLREALRRSGRVGIARVVIRSREHLAALRPHGDALVLDLMHWHSEIVDQKELAFPSSKEAVPAPEMKMAMTLIDAMTKRFDPTELHDRYREQLLALIEARARGKALHGTARAPQPTNVLNLLDVLERSIAASRPGQQTDGAQTRGGRAPVKAKPKHGAKRTKKSAA